MIWPLPLNSKSVENDRERRVPDDLFPSQSIPNFEELPCTAATRSIVASKNRFLNILPIDATRVILNLLNEDPATDYINGNYISVCQLFLDLCHRASLVDLGLQVSEQVHCDTR